MKYKCCDLSAIQTSCLSTVHLWQDMKCGTYFLSCNLVCLPATSIDCLQSLIFPSRSYAVFKWQAQPVESSKFTTGGRVGCIAWEGEGEGVWSTKYFPPSLIPYHCPLSRFGTLPRLNSPYVTKMADIWRQRRIVMFTQSTTSMIYFQNWTRSSVNNNL